MRYISFVILVVLVLISRAALAAAQDAGDVANSDPIALLDRIKTVTEQLNLTADQKMQVDAVFRSSTDELHSAMEDLKNATPEEKTDRFGQLFGDLRRQIGQLLADEQKTQLQENLQTLRNPATAPQGIGSLSDQSAQTPAADGQRPGLFGQNGGSATGGGLGTQVLKRLKFGLSQIGLSTDQQAQTDQLLQGIQEQLQTMHAGVAAGSVDRASVREKVLSIFDSGRTKLASILTVDQQTKLRQLLPQNPVAPGNLAPGAVAGNAAAPPPSKPQAQPDPASVQKPVAGSQIPALGQQAPDFEPKKLDGETVDLASYNHKVLVLVLGSYTNPTLRDRSVGLEGLREHYSGLGVSFLLVYTRETHPVGGWEIERNKTDNISISQPTTQAERNRIAESAREALHLSMTFAVDTMDDKTATAFAVGDGVAAYVIGRDDKILFHQSWLEPMALGDAIEDAVK
jgi:hypothetical protein